VATEHDLYKNIEDFGACSEFEMLKVKVPIVFLGTVGFSLPREGRYISFVALISIENCNALRNRYSRSH